MTRDMKNLEEQAAAEEKRHALQLEEDLKKVCTELESVKTNTAATESAAQKKIQTLNVQHPGGFPKLDFCLLFYFCIMMTSCIMSIAFFATKTIFLNLFYSAKNHLNFLSIRRHLFRKMFCQIILHKKKVLS